MEIVPAPPQPQQNSSLPQIDAQPPAVRPAGRKLAHALFAGAALVAMVVASYAPALRAGFIWDDDFYVTENATLHTLAGLRDIWLQPGAVPQYYPLVHTTFWIEQHLWGLDPRGYHAVNILLHAINVLLLWRLLDRLQVPGAWFGAALFAVHPVEVESVAWITERKNVLSLALTLASMHCYLRFAPPEDRGPGVSDGPRPWLYYGAALALFLAALLTKTVVLSMPAVLLVIYWWRRGRLAWRDLLPLLPFFAVGLALGGLTVWMEKHHVGAGGEEWELSSVQRLLLAGRALWFYVQKLAWPHPLIFFYPRWTIDLQQWWQFLFPLAALGVIVALWLARGAIGRGPLAAVLIFAGVLTPALGFFDVYPFRYSFVADHFQYHASVALLALAAAGGAHVAARRKWLRRGGQWIVVGAVLLVMGTLTFRQTFIYRDLESLYTDTIVKNPTSWAAYTNLSRLRVLQGREPEGLVLARQALEIAPQVSDVQGNVGAFLLAQASRNRYPSDELAAAQEYLQKAVDLDARNSLARKGLAYAFLESGHPGEAAAQFAAVLELVPHDADALVGLAQVEAAASHWQEAQRHLERAIERNPGLAQAHYHLATALAHLGEVDAALNQLEQALQLDPCYAAAHFDLGNLLMQRGQFALAAEHYEQASKLPPQSDVNFNNWGVALLALGRAEQAANCFQEALRLQPDNAEARANLQRARDALQQPPR